MCIPPAPPYPFANLPYTTGAALGKPGKFVEVVRTKPCSRCGRKANPSGNLSCCGCGAPVEVENG